MDHTKLDQADLDFPCRELSVRGLGFIVGLLFFLKLIFCVRLLGVQSSCITSINYEQLSGASKRSDKLSYGSHKLIKITKRNIICNRIGNRTTKVAERSSGGSKDFCHHQIH